jgi:hypothetical protein
LISEKDVDIAENGEQLDSDPTRFMLWIGQNLPLTESQAEHLKQEILKASQLYEKTLGDTPTYSILTITEYKTLIKQVKSEHNDFVQLSKENRNIKAEIDTLKNIIVPFMKKCRANYFDLRESKHRIE